MHEPLSQRLAHILEAESVTEGLTLNELLVRTEGRGLYLVIVLLSVPFIAPLPLPGVSTILGCVIGLLAIRLGMGLPPRLPRFMGERPLPPGLKRLLLGGSVKFLRLVEKLVRPRRTQWLSWPVARVGNSLVILAMAFLLALPIPPVILFSNSLPSFAIILVAVSMMEEDGLMIWLAYLAALIAMAWMGLSAGVIAGFVTKLYHRILEHLQTAP